ncbi:MAG: hypothetical protein JEZ03_00125 [Bacteroidales bacterium]|nr:hypothetical protein [Bacteroidales bacterium]
MSRILILAVLFSVFSSQASVNYSDFFTENTMRYDYFHTGTADQEHFAFDAMVNDGSWAGSKTQLIDELRLGKYFMEIQELESNMVIYSKGFSSIYGEWETTPEAKQEWGVFHESVRFPWPKKEVKLVILKRNNDNGFDPVFEYVINPKHFRSFPAQVKNYYNTFPIVESGDPSTCVDIVVLGEGYAKEDMDKFHKDAKRFAEVLLKAEPYASYKDKISIRAVETPAPQSGVNHPHQDIHTRSALSVTYGAFDSQRYALGYDNKTIRDAAAAVPYEYTAILMNDSIYGGGGIYNLYITAAVNNAFQEYLFVHEFGHHFADLADEYYTSATAYEMNADAMEPWELNVTANPDLQTIKWKEIITEGTPIPTPWEQDKYNEYSIEVQKKRQEMRARKASETEMETFFLKKKAWDEDLLSHMDHSDEVGAFEGARYEMYGMYRSQANCIMFTRHDKHCKACQRAIRMVIEQNIK